MRARAIIFDLFGTLVDESSERDALEAAWRGARDRFELEAAAADLAGAFAVALLDRVAAEKDLPSEGPVGPYEAAAKDALDDVLREHGLLASDEDRAWFWMRLLSETRAAVRMFPDAAPCLAAVAPPVRHVGVSSGRTRPNVPIRHVGVLTDADPGLAALLLEATGLGRHVHSVTSSAEAGAFKPDPAPFLLALQRADAAAHETVMVGDSWERDIEPALSIGMRGVLLDRHGARTVDAPVKVRSLAEIPALVETR
ncbi:MAG TPA: HAD family hydrolase [Candidatus Thermoplasmatota archaeon]|nr:HAD family hydrolase [Candidatus Thermoplasmatota archaeon]